MPIPQRPPMTARHTPVARACAALALLASGAIAACGGRDPFAPQAFSPVNEGLYVVFPLTGSPASLPAGVDLGGGLTVRPTLFYAPPERIADPNFDIAFDRDPQGRTVIYSPRWISAPPGGVPRAGLQIVNVPFDSLRSAPTSGYVYDSLLTVLPGQTVAIATSGLRCDPSRQLHARLRVDSIGAGNAIYATIRVNPNCGFRSFVNGANGRPES